MHLHVTFNSSQILLIKKTLLFYFAYSNLAKLVPVSLTLSDFPFSHLSANVRIFR